MQNKKLFLTCKCKSHKHFVCLNVLNPPKDHFEPFETVLTVNLNHNEKWYMRLITGIKYMFGFETKHNCDDIILGYEEITELRNFTEKSVKEYDFYIDSLIASGKLKITPQGKLTK